MTKKNSEPKIPSDLTKAFATHPVAKTKWQDLTPLARRDFITWIKGAKQPETRMRRITKTCSMLLAGKRRPCCYALVPMNLYKALGTNPKAKAQWKTLTPSARRDFIDWIDAAKESETHKRRIERISTVLATGKRRL